MQETASNSNVKAQLVARRVRVTQEVRAGFPFPGSGCCADAEPHCGLLVEGSERKPGFWRRDAFAVAVLVFVLMPKISVDTRFGDGVREQTIESG